MNIVLTPSDSWVALAIVALISYAIGIIVTKMSYLISLFLWVFDVDLTDH